MSNKRKFYKDLDKVAELFKQFLDKYSKSKALQKFAHERYKSFVFAQLINNFFLNLTANNTKEENLPSGFIGKIKVHFKELHKTTAIIISDPFGADMVNKKTYTDFKKELKRKFPEFIKIVRVIEHEVSYKELLLYINSIKPQFAAAGTNWDPYDIN